MNIKSYLRPWKLVTLLIGLSILIIGSFLVDAPDWDVTISFIMGLSTYFTAPVALRIIITKNYKLFALALFFYWISVDGFYSFYWYLVDPEALMIMREANFYASTCLYWLCAFIWLYDGSLKELRNNVLNVMQTKLST